MDRYAEETAYVQPAPSPSAHRPLIPPFGHCALFRSLPPYGQQDLGQSVETLAVAFGTQAVLAESLPFRARCSTSQSWAITFPSYACEIFTGDRHDFVVLVEVRLASGAIARADLRSGPGFRFAREDLSRIGIGVLNRCPNLKLHLWLHHFPISLLR